VTVKGAHPYQENGRLVFRIFVSWYTVHLCPSKTADIFAWRPKSPKRMVHASQETWETRKDAPAVFLICLSYLIVTPVSNLSIDTSTIKQIPPFRLHIFVLFPNLCRFFCVLRLLAPVLFVFKAPWHSRLFPNRTRLLFINRSCPFFFVSYSSPIAYKSPGVLGPVPIPLSSLLTHILFCHRRYFALTSDRNTINGGGLLFSDEQLPSCHSLPLNRPSLYRFIPFWSRLLRPYRQIQVTRRSSSRIPWILFSPSPKKVGVNRLQLPIFVPLYILDVLYFFLHVKGCSC